jgi:hypothetical protein
MSSARKRKIARKGATDMATVPSRSLRTARDVLDAVKHLPPGELQEFQQQFAAWSAENNGHNGTLLAETDEDSLLAAVRDNSTLPPAEQRRFNRLRRKRQAGTLSKTEEQQLQALWSRVEQMNATRLEALAELARRRGIDVKTVMAELGLRENRDVF